MITAERAPVLRSETRGRPSLEGSLPIFDPGSVWLVGAGPGDPGLLTVLALKALETADVVLYDALVSESILSLARPEAIRRYVGKRASRRSPAQAEISELLVGYARAGFRVLRLKGGDPCVFGRGGEEAKALAEAGLPFRIVPGVTAALGALAYAGIPVTYRGLNCAVTFVTGHDAAGGPPESLDWEALAKGSPVLVFYMALRNIDRIAARLIAAGRPPSTPVAFISNGTMAAQSVVKANLATCAREARRYQVRPPAIIVIGEVVRLSEILDWFQPAAAAAGGDAAFASLAGLPTEASSQAG